MRTFYLLLALALAGCGQGSGSAKGEIIGHRWARTLAECGDTYLDFSRNMIDFVQDGRTVNALPVRQVTRDPSDSSRVRFVIEADGALADKSIGSRAGGDVSMVFKLSGDSLKLVDQGSGAGAKAYAGFTLRRCPS